MAIEQGQKGEWFFNKTNFPKISKKIRENINQYHNYCYEVAILIYNELKENKVKKNPNDAYDFIFNKIKVSKFHSLRGFIETTDCNQIKGHSFIKNTLSMEITSDVFHKAMDEIFRNNNNTLLKPRKSSFPHIKNNEKDFVVTFEDSITISVLDSDKSVNWIIHSNNHAVDRVEGRFYYNFIFPIINQHEFKKGESGVLITKTENTSDEYDAEQFNFDYVYFGKNCK